jgi:hypothetical protein
MSVILRENREILATPVRGWVLCVKRPESKGEWVSYDDRNRKAVPFDGFEPPPAWAWSPNGSKIIESHGLGARMLDVPLPERAKQRIAPVKEG